MPIIINSEATESQLFKATVLSKCQRACKKKLSMPRIANFTLSTDPVGHTRHVIYVWAQLYPTKFLKTPDIDQNVRCS